MTRANDNTVRKILTITEPHPIAAPKPPATAPSLPSLRNPIIAPITPTPRITYNHVIILSLIHVGHNF